MSDGQRVYPVDNLIIHHTGTNGTDFVGMNDQAIQDWFDRVGKQHGYDPAGVGRSYHMHPSRDKETFSQYQAALVPNGDADDPNTDWRLVPLMRDPWDNVAWGAGHWPTNQRGYNVCLAGNRVGRPLNKKALFRLAKFWQPQDTKLGGNTVINAHGWITSTACPGEPKNQIVSVLVPYVNDIGFAERDAFPKPVEPPKPPTWDNKYLPLPEPVTYQTHKAGLELVDFVSNKVVQTYGVGDKITVKYGTTPFNGHVWLITEFSKVSGKSTGFRSQDLQEHYAKVFVEPTPEPEPVKPVYKVVHGLRTIISTNDEELARNTYRMAEPTEDEDLVQLVRDAEVLETKSYVPPVIEPKPEPEKPTDPQPHPETLFDAIAQIVTKVIEWLKGWRRS